MADGSRPTDGRGDESPRKRVGNVIRAEMAERGLRIDDICELTGMKYKQVSNLLTGRKIIDAEIAIIFSDLFGRDPDFWETIESNIDNLEEHKSKYPRVKDSKECNSKDLDMDTTESFKGAVDPRPLGRNEFRVEFNNFSVAFSYDTPPERVIETIKRFKLSFE